MRRLAITLLASSALAGLGQAASAADIRMKAPVSAPIAAAAYNWSGFYIGAHFGGGWARQQDWTGIGGALPTGGDDDPPLCDETGFDGFFCGPTQRGSHNAIGVLGGGQAGFNWQNGAFVFGIEGQYSFANLKGDHGDSFSAVFSDTGSTFCAVDGFCSTTFNQTDRFSTKIKGIATLAARIGLAHDRMLFYVKGGPAWMKANYAQTSNLIKLECNTDDVGEGCEAETFTAQLGGSKNRWGWMAGTGFEYGLFDNWSAKVEYNYLHFGNKTVTLAGTACEPGDGCDPISRDFRINQSIHLIKFGLNYRFGNFGKGPLVARY